MKSSLTVLLMLVFAVAYSQDFTDSVVRWHSDHTLNISSTKDVEMEGSTLLFTRKDHIEWRNGRGKIIHTFLVQEASGALSNNGADGQLVYKVLNDTAKGTVTISRVNKRETIHVFLLVDAKPQNFDFSVKSKVVL